MKNEWLSVPWSKEPCADSEAAAGYNVASVYTEEACRSECKVKYFAEKCGCDFLGVNSKYRACLGT